jgi:hypothetical protein
MIPVRYSNLKLMAQSPMHYKHAEGRPDDSPPRNRSMLVGTAGHKMILTAGKTIVVFDGKTRRGKAWDAFKLEHDGKIILNEAEYADAKAMADAVGRDPRAQALLMRAPHREQTLRWQLAGRDCRGTPDAFGDDILLDVKTTRTAHPDRFAWEARRMGYHGQLDWYRHGLLHVGAPYAKLPTRRQCFVIAVENKAPYPVTVFELTEDLLNEGRTCWSAWFERYCVCSDSNHWPAYSECIEPLDVAKEDDMGFDVPTGEITADDAEEQDDE